MSGTPGGGPKPTRGIFLTVMTPLYVLLAISNFTKPIQRLRHRETAGLVILGHRLESFGANLFFGPLFGLIIFAYAWGVWKMKWWVLPIAMVYAVYVPVNLTLFWFTHGSGEHPSMNFIILYLVLSLSGSVISGLYLSYHHDRLS